MKKISLFLFITIIILQSKAQQLNLQFAKQIGGVSGYGESKSIVLDGVGNIYTTGFFTGTMDFDPGVGSYNLSAGTFGDIFISKLDPSGNFLWAKQMVTTVPIFYNNIGYSLIVDNSGNVFTTGSFRNIVDFDPGVNSFTINAGSNYNTFISKLDANGNFVWAKNFVSPNGNGASSIKLDANGNVTTIGWFNPGCDFDPGPGTYTFTGRGVFISKLNSTGNFISARQYKSSTGSDDGLDLVFDLSGNMYTTGYFQSTIDFNPGSGSYTLTSKNAKDAFIAKHDPLGNFLWAKQLEASFVAAGVALDVDAAGNIYTTGYFTDTLDCDPGANIFNVIANGNYNIFVSKLNTNGSFLWAKQFLNTNINRVSGLSVDGNGNVYTSGYFRGTMDFNPGVGSYTLTSAGNYDAYISKSDQAGNFVWAIQIGDTSIDLASDVTIDAAGNIYTTGNFAYIVDFDPGTAVTNLSSMCVNNSTTYSYGDIFVQKICQGACQTAIDEMKISDAQVEIFPNPANDELNISYNAQTKMEFLKISIYNSIGQLIREEELKNNSINIKDLPNGVYLLSLRQAQADKSGSVSKRFVIAR